MVKVREVGVFVANMRTRMPFRYGIAAMTVVPHVFVRVAVEVDGRQSRGIPGVAADHLPPKWFTKDPGTTYEADVAEMLGVIDEAAALAVGVGEAESVFDWWRGVYGGMMGEESGVENGKWRVEGGSRAKPQAAGAKPQAAPGRRAKPQAALLRGFGVSLVERAVMDAFCRAMGVPFGQALRENLLGMRLGEIHPELAGYEPAGLLPAAALRSITVRHTVGLGDPLTPGDVTPAERVEDGLPQSLEEAIKAYGLTHFKIKLCGDPKRDLERLTRIAKVIVSDTREFAFTLDGNEQYHQVAPFRELWETLAGDELLKPFLKRMIVVEQPLHRDMALSEQAEILLRDWKDRPPIIIDESDAELGSLRRAIECGYVGTSYKSCKGVFKGVANACLIEFMNRLRGDDDVEAKRQGFVMTGEDLCNVGPVALLQDLAVAANLGIEHVERNGHHYFAGLSMLPPEVQELVLGAHGDLYQRVDPGVERGMERGMERGVEREEGQRSLVTVK
ncbi:MAG: hypothetical protein WD042_14865, partial [Phycisphaeraceae bacterium]